MSISLTRRQNVCRRVDPLLILVVSAQFVSASEISSTDPGTLLRIAENVASNARTNMIGASGAVQVSRVAGQAQLELSLITTRQNEVIIILLRALAKERP